MTQWNSNCAKTYAHYVYNNSTQLWDAFSGYNFDKGTETDNQITIGVSAADYSSYRPEVYYLIKTTWTSTYSERTDGYMEELFYIRFYDACYVN